MATSSLARTARNRLVRDFEKIRDDNPPSVTAAPIGDNIMQWQAVIFGPEDTIWQDGVFRLTLDFTDEYPNKPPSVRFVSRIYHPNVYGDGKICLDILQNQWSPIFDVCAILMSIQSLLNDPNPQSPANAEAARMFESNRLEYSRKVREVVEASWGDAGDDEEET